MANCPFVGCTPSVFFFPGANLDAQLMRARHAFCGWLLVTRSLWRSQESDPACLLPRRCMVPRRYEPSWKSTAR